MLDGQHQLLDQRLNEGVQFDWSLLSRLVENPSPTENFELVHTIQKIIEFELTQLNFKSQWIENPVNLSAPLLYSRREGRLGDKKVITLVFHADTVSSLSWSHEIIYNPESDNLIAPGIADNKGGIAMAICALKNFFATCDCPDITIQVVSSPNEEAGSTGFHTILKDIGRSSHVILGFEPALGAEGKVITSRSGNAWYHFRTEGLHAHSGRMDPHVNAAHEVSLKIAKIAGLNNLEKGIRANIGALRSSGDRFNIICGEIEAKLDLRYTTHEQQKELCSTVEDILQDSSLACPFTQVKTATDWSVKDLCPPMEERAGNINLKHCFHTINQTSPDYVGHSGGAADINYMDHSEAACIDGLGPIGGKMHTKDEFIRRSEVLPRLRSVTQLLHTLNTN